MHWSFDNNRPIYLQLVEKIELMIIAGQYQLGQRLPAVRELAAEIAVNPNTLQRAFSELEDRNLVFTQRTSGRFITEDATVIEMLRETRAKEVTKQFLAHMAELGYDESACITMLSQTTQ